MHVTLTHIHIKCVTIVRCNSSHVLSTTPQTEIKFRGQSFFSTADGAEGQLQILFHQSEWQTSCFA